MKQLGSVIVLAVLCNSCGASSEGEADAFDSAEQPIYGGIVDPTYPEIGSIDDNCAATLIARDVAVTSGECAVGYTNHFFNASQFRKGSAANNFVTYSVDAAIQHPSRDIGVIHLTAPALPASSTGVALGSRPAVGAFCTTYGFGEYDPVTHTSVIRKRSALVKTTRSSATSFDTTKVTGIPTAGDAGAPMLCNGALAGVTTTTLDGTGTDHVLVQNASMDATWVGQHSDLHPPTVQQSLYVRNDTWLWRVESGLGNMELATRGFVSTFSMAAVGTRIYSSNTTSSQLIVTDAATGEGIDAINVSGGASAILHAKDNVLYALQGGALWKYTDLTTGARTRLVGASWLAPTSMSSLGNLLFVIDDGFLWRVSPLNGLRIKLGPQDWKGQTAMAGVGSTLYIAQDGKLWTVTDFISGNYQLFQDEDWSGPLSMASLNGFLWVVQGGRLHRVDPTSGSYTLMTPKLFTQAVNLVAIP